MAIGDGKRGGRGVMSWVKPDVAEHTLTSALAIVAMGVGWKVLNQDLILKVPPLPVKLSGLRIAAIVLALFDAFPSLSRLSLNLSLMSN